MLQIEALIEELLAEGFSAEQIVIAGFSQGGVMAYYTGLTSCYKLAGMLILSAYLPDASLLDVAKIQHKINTPILVCHGSQDPVVGVDYAKLATQYLQQLGLEFDWHEYPMAHSVCYEEIVDIAHWLLQIFPK